MLLAVSHNRAFCDALAPTHVVRVANGAMRMEDCFGLEDSDFEHEAMDGDAAAVAAKKEAEEVVMA